MSFAMEVQLVGLDEAEAMISRLDPLDTGKMLEGIARLIQMQTRRRIETEKTAPDGGAWPKNKAGTPTLFRTGDLSRSIDYAVMGNRVVVGSGLIYAAPHQFGATITPKTKPRLAFVIGGALVYAMKVVLPPRPFVGVSASNAAEIMEAVVDFLRRKLA